MTFILAALLIIIFTATAAVAKTRKVKRAALIGLIVVLAALCGLVILAYVHVVFYAGQFFWPEPLLWIPFFLLCCGILAVLTYLRKLSRVS